MILLSVIIPARNEFPNIVHTVYSILHCWEADGFDPKQIEIIVVNNCSTDRKEPQRGTGGTTDYLMPRGGYHNRCIRVLYDPIAGNHSARNKGAAIARGEYLYFSDAHMALRPGFFKSILKTVDESGGLVHGALQHMGAYPPTDSGAGFAYTIKLGEEIKGCVDETTEILTKAGWKKWNEVSKKTEFATVNVKTKEIEFQKPTSILIQKRKGVMYHWTGRSVDAFLTPYHRCPYISQTDRLKNRHEWREKTAEKIVSTDRLPLKTKGITKLDSKFPDYLVELLAWIITEGSYNVKPKNERVTIVQYNAKNRKRIISCAKKFGYSFHVSKRGDVCIAQNGAKKIFELLPTKELTFVFINKLSRKQLELLYQVLIDADGTHNNNGHESFVQVNQNTIDAFQYLCVLIGKQSKWFTKKPEYFKGNHFGRQDIQVVSVKKNVYASNFKIEKKKYNGIVWCPTVPNGSIFMRRNGKTMPSLNTWNNYKLSDRWWYISCQGHWGLAVKRQQFLDFGGYPDVHRTYGGGEVYTDWKWWMYGSTVAVDPNAIGYHLSAGRGYSYQHRDYIENVLGIAYALGLDDWRERAYINWSRTTSEQTMNEIIVRNEREYGADRARIARRRKMTFNEMLVKRPWDMLNDKRHGVHNGSLLIFHDTWLNIIKNDERVLKLYQNSRYQVQLEAFINKELSQFVYGRK